MSNLEEGKKTETQEDTEQASADTEESQEWLKKLGAVPASQCYEDSPELQRMEEALSTKEEKPKEEKEDDIIYFRKYWGCHHLTTKKIAEVAESNTDPAAVLKILSCPVKVAIERTKRAFHDTLTKEQKEMVAWYEHLPCHICIKYYERGLELLKQHRPRKDQIEFLREFDLREERPVSNPNYSHVTNHNRKRTARSLEKRKLIRILPRLRGSPANPEKPEPTWVARLSLVGHLACDKNRERIEKNLSRILLKKPLAVLAQYIQRLEKEREQVSEFIKTRKRQRTDMGQWITKYRATLDHKHKFMMKSLGILPEEWSAETDKEGED